MSPILTSGWVLSVNMEKPTLSGVFFHLPRPPFLPGDGWAALGDPKLPGVSWTPVLTLGGQSAPAS